MYPIYNANLREVGKIDQLPKMKTFYKKFWLNIISDVSPKFEQLARVYGLATCFVWTPFDLHLLPSLLVQVCEYSFSLFLSIWSLSFFLGAAKKQWRKLKKRP